MSKLKSICDEVIAAGERATDRPWLFQLQENATEPNKFYLELSANHADKLARAVLVMEEALSNTLNYLHHNTDNLCGDDLIGDGRLTSRFKQRVSEVEKAINQAHEILK